MASKLAAWLVAVKTKDGLKAWVEPSREQAFLTRDDLIGRGIVDEVYVFRLSLFNGRMFVERKGGSLDNERRNKEGS